MFGAGGAEAAHLSILVDVASGKANAQLNGFGKNVENVSNRGKKAMQLFGIASATSLGVFAVHAIAAATEARKMSAQTDAVIKSTGGAAHVTAGQVKEMADHLQNVSGVEKENIQNGENLLLTFTQIQNRVGAGNDIFNRATSTMLDMSVALGEDIPSAAIQLGKALNDPIRGVTALRRVGVSFTTQQQDEIKALVNSGQALKAQKLILAELTKEFGGSAAAIGAARSPLEKLQLQFHDFSVLVGGYLIDGINAFTQGFSGNVKGLEGWQKAVGVAGQVAHAGFSAAADGAKALWGALQSIVGIISSVIGWLSKNKAVLLLVTAAFIGSGLAARGFSMALSGFGKLGLGIQLGIAGIVASLIAFNVQAKNAKDQANATSWAQGLTTGAETASQKVDILTKKLVDLKKRGMFHDVGPLLTNIANPIAKIATLGFWTTPVDTARNRKAALQKEIKDIQTQVKTAQQQDLADRKNYSGQLGTIIGKDAANQVAASKTSTDAIKAELQAMQQMNQQISQSFESQTSVVDAFSGKTNVTFGQLQQFFNTTGAGAKTWADNLDKAAKMGLDQGVVQQIAQAGPKAGGLLDAIVKDTSGKTLKMINDNAINMAAIEAKATQTADQMKALLMKNQAGTAKELGEAYRIQIAAADLGSKGTVAAIAKQLGLGTGQVRTIAASYGITLTGEVEKKKADAAAAANHLADSIVNTVRNNLTGGRGLGSSFSGGIIAGLQSAFPGLYATAKKIADIIKQTIANAHKTKSPSQEAIKLGAFFTQGLAIGLLKDSSRVQDAAKMVANQAMVPFGSPRVPMGGSTNGSNVTNNSRTSTSHNSFNFYNQHLTPADAVQFERQIEALHG